MTAEALALARSLALLSDTLAAGRHHGAGGITAARHAARRQAAREFDLPDPETWAAS